MIFYTVKELGTRPALFDQVVVGEKMGPFTYPVDDYSVKAYAFSIDNYNPWYFTDQNPWSKRIAHASFPCNDMLSVFLTIFDPNAALGLHTGEELWFSNPIFVGENVTLTAEFVDKFEKRGKGYYIQEGILRGEDGRQILKARSTEIIHFEGSEYSDQKTAKVEGDVVTGEYDESISPVKKASPELSIDVPLMPCEKIFHAEQSQMYAWIGQGFSNIHNNFAFAKAGGYKTLVVQGMQQLACIVEMMVDFFGISWFSSGHLKIKNLRTIYIDEKVTLQAVVKSKSEENGKTRLYLHVWTKNMDGKMSILGWADALVD